LAPEPPIPTTDREAALGRSRTEVLAGALSAAKIGVALLILVGALVVLFGVSQKAPSGRTLIRYCQWSGVRHQPVVWEIKKAFERENPDIEVKLEFYSRAYWQKLYTMIAAGVAPDVWYVSCPYMIDLARQGSLEGLTPLIERDGVDMDRYYRVVTDSFKWRGRQFSMSMQFGAIALYYNRDLFDRAGLAYPNTKWSEAEGGRRMAPHPWKWADLLAAARALTKDTDGDGIVDQFGFLVTPSAETCVSAFVYENGGAFMDEKRERVTLDTDEAVGAVQFVQDLQWKHKVAPTPESAGTQGLGAVDLFETGKIAMTFDGSWRMDYYNRSGSLNYDVAALPSGPGGHRGMVANGLANGLNAASKHKEAAWKWIKFYAGISGANDTSKADAQMLLAKMKRGIPILKRVARSEAFLNPKAEPQHEHVFLDQMVEARDMWPAYGWNEWMGEKVRPEINILLNRGPQAGRTVREAMEKATRESNAIMDRVKAEQELLDRARAGAGAGAGGGD